MSPDLCGLGARLGSPTLKMCQTGVITLERCTEFTHTLPGKKFTCTLTQSYAHPLLLFRAAWLFPANQPQHSLMSCSKAQPGGSTVFIYKQVTSPTS